MEYTKDVIFNVKYTKKAKLIHSQLKKISTLKFLKIFKKTIEVLRRDDYFTLTIIISILFLSIDYLIIKRFIEIVNLL